jgi:hypothetical protein
MSERLKALKEGDWIQFSANRNPKCPHCGHVCDIQENEWWDLYQEGDHEKHCPSCGLEFVIDACCEYTFNTDEQEDDDADPA